MQSKETQNRGRQQLNSLNLKLSTQIESVMTKLGMDLTDYVCCEQFIRGPAPCHGGDNRTAFVYYHSTARWKCWTNKCEEDFHGDIVGLIRAVLNTDFKSAIKCGNSFAENTNMDESQLQELRQKRQKSVREVTKNYWKDHNEPEHVFSDETLKNLNSAAKFAEQRSLDSALFDAYGIGYAWKGPLTKRVVVPVRNIAGKIVGFSGRQLIDNPDFPKWYHWPTGHKYEKFRTSIHLFNIGNAFSHCIANDKSTYIIVEGPFDVIKMEMAGVHNSLCTFGNGITEGQMEILKQIGATKVLVAYDGDAPGNKGADIAAKKLEKKLFDSSIIRLTDVFPEWNDDKLGSLDWANPNVHTTMIKGLFDCHEVSNM